MDKISPERLQELIDGYEEDARKDGRDVNDAVYYHVFKELQSLREQNKVLIADAERLYGLVVDFEKYAHVVGTENIKAQHNALMQELGCSPK